MLGFHMPPDSPGSISRVFDARMPSGVFVPMLKPRGISMVMFTTIGGGAGGGGGRGGATSSTRTGGGGGGSGSIGTFLYPACFLPDVWYVHTGKGGLGGTAGSSANGGNGADADLSYVAIKPGTLTTDQQEIFAISGLTTGGGGVGGNTSSGTAGTIGTVSVGTLDAIVTTVLAASFGFSQWTVGSAGSIGNDTAGVNLGAGSKLLLGGTGGGGVGAGNVQAVGGSITASGSLPLLPGGVIGGGAGQQGYCFRSPRQTGTIPNMLAAFRVSGGTGGGGNSAGTGGAGGKGAIGCGGGGGAGGLNLGGIGGDGGDGLVLVNCW
jgi:hypothetical protein